MMLNAALPCSLVRHKSIGAPRVYASVVDVACFQLILQLSLSASVIAFTEHETDWGKSSLFFILYILFDICF